MHYYVYALLTSITIRY